MAQCLTPFTKNGENVPLPCGKCPTCCARRASFWSFRLMKQYENCQTAYFVTFTYNNENLPIVTNKGTNGNKDYEAGTLYKQHSQNFFRALRQTRKRKAKTLQSTECTTHRTQVRPPSTRGRTTRLVAAFAAVKQAPLIYYLAGEYGTDRYRPHYHAIIFNLELAEILTNKEVKLALFSPEIYLDGYTEYTSRHWPHGHITIGTVNHESVGYCLKYISKPKHVGFADWDNRQKEFSLMSKGIGKNYLTDNIIKWHKEGGHDRLYTPLKDGKKIALPRYYKQKIWTDKEDLENIHQEYIHKMQIDRQLKSYQQHEKETTKKHLILLDKLKIQNQNYEKSKKHSEGVQSFDSKRPTK